MESGAFSISLTVKDINVSKAFYEKLGFEMFSVARLDEIETTSFFLRT